MSERDRVSHWLIHHAALAAPASLSERLEEEWLADLATRRSALSRWRFALGCCWATRVIAHELRAAAVPAAGSALAAKLAFGELGSGARLFARRPIALLVVVSLHVALFYGLMYGLGSSFNEVIPSTLQARIIPQLQPRELPPPLAPPPLTRGKLEVSPPEFTPPQDLTGPSELDTQPQSMPPQSPPVTPPHEASRVQGGPGNGFPDPHEYYPSAARRLEEQGVATVRVCVDTRGRLTADPTTVQSTGSSRLDAGALQLAKAGSGHYRPTTEDGRPMNACYPFRVRFELKN